MENLVIGNLKPTADGNFEVEFRLIDVYKEEVNVHANLEITEKKEKIGKIKQIQARINFLRT